MTWAAVAGAAVAVVGGAMNNRSQKKAANAAAGSQQAVIDEQRRQYDQSRQDYLPWLNAGGDALGQMQRLNSGDFSSFTHSPDYRFAYDQGMQALDRSAASRGNLFSGGQQADLMKFGHGLASQNYNTYYNRLASLAGVGQQTAGGLASLGQNTANGVGNALTNIGNTRASMYQNQGDNNAQTAGALGNLFSNYMGQRNGSGSTGWGWGGI